MIESSPPSATLDRASQIFQGHLLANYVNVDRMFAVLLLCEWVASIIVALLVSPRAWAGEFSNTHIHVWAALILGGTVVSLPIALILVVPGQSSTRRCVAVAQMLMVGLLIHLSGGRPEAHFHVFVSLAFVALYRDWRALVIGGAVVAVDHFSRGIYWPRSVFGTLGVDRWRWVEHALWVIFEGGVLTYGINHSLRLIRDSSRRQAEIEATRDRVELIVSLRTSELRLAHDVLEDRVRDRTTELEKINEILRDEVAERFQAEEDLRASEDRFRTLAETLPSIVWVTNSEGMVEYFNACWFEYTGLTAGESLGDRWKNALHPDDLARTAKVWGEAVASGEAYQIEYRFRRGKDASYRWHLGRGLPLRDENGWILRWIGTSTDIDDQKSAADSLREAHDLLENRVRERTAALEQANLDLLTEVAERRKAESEALRSREAAEEATKSKSDFLANMSHEIRTPMNAIIGMTELTLDMEMPDSQRENLEVVRVAADSLLVLIDDILDFSKIEAGKLDIDPIRFSPRETIEQAILTLWHRAQGKGLALSGFVAPEVPDALIGDSLRLRQVLLNLLGNAIKFTNQGRVELRVAVEASGPGFLELRFSVSDQGIGIPESRQAMIFDPFSQADGSTTRKFGGTGLGLSISTRLVRLMGGRIWVESEVGRGSVFHFTVRLGTTHQQALATTVRIRIPSTSTRRRKILLVDDNELNRRVGKLIIEKLGHEVLVARDGLDSIARFERNGPFDLILMDIQMPGMDGFEATTKIRAIQEKAGRRCPIVALTAFAMKSDRKRSLDAGLDDHLAKPIRVDDLAKLIERLVVDDGDSPGAPAPRWCQDPEEIRLAFPMSDAEMVDIVRLFRESCVDEIARMSRAIVEGNPSTLSKAAHGLMGYLGMFGTEATVALAADLESAGRNGRLAGTESILARFAEAIDGMQPTLDLLIESPEPDHDEYSIYQRQGSN